MKKMKVKAVSAIEITATLYFSLLILSGCKSKTDIVETPISSDTLNSAKKVLSESNELEKDFSSIGGLSSLNAKLVETKRQELQQACFESNIDSVCKDSIANLAITSQVLKNSYEKLAGDYNPKQQQKSKEANTSPTQNNSKTLNYKSTRLIKVPDKIIFYYRSIEGESIVPSTSYNKLVLKIYQNLDAVHSTENLNRKLEKYKSEIDSYCPENRYVRQCSHSWANFFVIYNRLVEFHNTEIIVNSYF